MDRDVVLVVQYPCQIGSERLAAGDTIVCRAATGGVHIVRRCETYAEIPDLLSSGQLRVTDGAPADVLSLLGRAASPSHAAPLAPAPDAPLPLRLVR